MRLILLLVLYDLTVSIGRCDTCQPDVCTKLLTDLECASSGILGINKVSCGDRGDNFDELTAVRRSCSGRSSCNLKNTHITWSTCCNTTDSNRYVQFQCVSKNEIFRPNVCQDFKKQTKVDSKYGHLQSPNYPEFIIGHPALFCSWLVQISPPGAAKIHIHDLEPSDVQHEPSLTFLYWENGYWVPLREDFGREVFVPRTKLISIRFEAKHSDKRYRLWVSYSALSGQFNNTDDSLNSRCSWRDAKWNVSTVHDDTGVYSTVFKIGSGVGEDTDNVDELSKTLKTVLIATLSSLGVVILILGSLTICTYYRNRNEKDVLLKKRRGRRNMEIRVTHQDLFCNDVVRSSPIRKNQTDIFQKSDDIKDTPLNEPIAIANQSTSYESIPNEGRHSCLPGNEKCEGTGARSLSSLLDDPMFTLNQEPCLPANEKCEGTGARSLSSLLDDPMFTLNQEQSGDSMFFTSNDHTNNIFDHSEDLSENITSSLTNDIDLDDIALFGDSIGCQVDDSQSRTDGVRRVQHYVVGNDDYAEVDKQNEYIDIVDDDEPLQYTRHYLVNGEEYAVLDKAFC